MSWEVRTMRSARSWCNLTLYKKNLTRFWPIWGLYLAIWLFLFPIALLLDNYEPARFAHKQVLDQIIYVGLPLAVVFSLLAACAVWSYLCNNRSTCLMHTLPIRREGLFLTSYLSGLTFLVGPNLVVFVLTLLAEAARGTVDVGALVMWLVCVSLIELFFFSFATFGAMCTGHILGLPVFYGIFNVLVMGLVWLLDLTLSRFVFGYTGVEGLWKAAKWLTPVWKLTEGLEVRTEIGEGAQAVESYWLSGLGYILIYVIFGLILTALALALYRRRHMERAGDVVTITWMRPVFQYGVAFCCALAFGTLVYEIFRGAFPEGAWTLLICMLLCGAAGYFLARMLLEKSFRVFHCWKGCVPFLAALVALVCVMELDLTGFERRVPDESDVASVRVWNMNTAPYDTGNSAAVSSADPEVIRAMLEAHRAVVENKDAIETGGSRGSGYDTTEGYSVQSIGYSGFQVTYTLENGKTLSRDYYYSLPVSAQELSDPDSLSAKLNALANLPQFIEASYGLAEESARNLVEISLDGVELVSEYGDWNSTEVLVNGNFQEELLQAVLADLEEGGLGRRYLLDDKERMNNCFVNDLYLTFYHSEESTGPVDEGVTTEASSRAYTTTIRVTLQTTARHTLAVLEQAGALESPVALYTQAQLDQISSALWEAEKEGNSTGLASEDMAWAVLGE